MRTTVRRFRIAAAAVALLVLAAIAVLVWQLWSAQRAERLLILQQAEHRATQLAASAAGRIGAMVRSVDFVLLELRRQHGTDTARFRDVAEMLRTAFPEEPQLLLQLSIAGPGGEIVHSSLPYAGGVNIADREHFRAHLDGHDRLFISQPVIGRISSAPTIQFTRPILLGGRFAGVAAVSISPEQIGRLLESLAAVFGGEITLLGAEGVVLSLSSGSKQGALLGAKPPEFQPLVRPGAAARGIIHGANSGGPAARAYAWHAVGDTGLIALVGLNRKTAISALEHHFRRTWGSVAPLSLALLALGAGVVALLFRIARRQQEVARSEARFRSLSQLSSDWFWEQDTQFRFTQLAGNLQERTGIAGSTHLGKTRWDMPAFNLTETDWARHRAELEAHLAFRDLEMLRIGADGQEHWVSISGEPVFDERGAFAGYRGAGREITERKRAEQALRDANERLRLGTITARMIVMDWDIARDEIRWSDSPEWLRGPLPASGRYPLWKDQVYPEDRERFLETRNRSVATGAGEMQDYRLVRTDGQVLWLRSHQKVFADSDGKAVRMIVAMLDITSQKAAQERLRLSEARLAEAQHLAQIGSWELDIAREALAWSVEVYRIFELEPAAFGGTLDAFYALVHPEDRAAVEAAYARSLEAREPYRIVHRLRMANGRVKWVEERCETEFGADGAPLRSLGTVQDITERRRLELALTEATAHVRRMSRQLREVEERERRAIARELHDRVGQNLSSLDLMLGMLGQQVAAGRAADAIRQIAQMREVLRESIGRTRDLMSELRPPALEEYGLFAALKDLAADTAQRSRVAVSAEGEAIEPRPPLATELSLYRIAQEALANAVRHARASRVRLQLARRGDTIELAIADDGVGFDPSVNPRAPSWGLATMRERAEEAGIDLAIDSAPGSGTCITLSARLGA